MCGMCPDCVEICHEGECGGPGSRYTGFYLGDNNMCDHMFDKYGTRKADLLYHVRQEHDPDDNFGRYVYICSDDCIGEKWWPAAEVLDCIHAVYYGRE